MADVSKVIKDNNTAVSQITSFFPLSSSTIYSYLWEKYCSLDGGERLLNRIIDGRNIKEISQFFSASGEHKESQLAILKSLIVLVGLEISPLHIFLKDDFDFTVDADITAQLDKAVSLFSGKYNNTEISTLDPVYFVKELAPKVYTVPSKYRYLDTVEEVLEDGCYKDIENIKEEFLAIYGDTVDTWEQMNGKSLKRIFPWAKSSNASVQNSTDEVKWAANIFLQINDNMDSEMSYEEYDYYSLFLNEILNTNESLYNAGIHWGLDVSGTVIDSYEDLQDYRSFILLFFKNLKERTINYK